MSELTASVKKIKKRTRVKVCGMTRVQDVRSAVELGVDAIGVILYANSPRLVSMEQAINIRAEVPAFVTLVGVFVDCDATLINDYVNNVGLDLVQLHGDESDEMGALLSAPYIKAIRARNKTQVETAIMQYPNSLGLLLDPYIQGQHGGTGRQMDMALWPDYSTKKLILAGGLSPDNLAAAVDRVSPFAVDLNSGVETAPGEKNIDLIESSLKALGW